MYLLFPQQDVHSLIFIDATVLCGGLVTGGQFVRVQFSITSPPYKVRSLGSRCMQNVHVDGSTLFTFFSLLSL